MHELRHRLARIGLYLVPIFVLAACEPYKFVMDGGHTIPCEIMTPLKTVEPGQSITTLHSGGAIDMSYFGATQYVATITTRLTQGEGFRVLLRPVVHQRDVIDSGIAVNITTQGVWLDSARQIFHTRREVKMPLDKNIQLVLLSENNFTQVILGCDTVYKGWSKSKESDDIVIQSLPGSEMQVILPDWRNVEPY